MQEFIELARQRYSMRQFSAQSVEEDKVLQLLEAARVAPTACNYQPQKILVLNDEADMEAIRRSTRYHFYAPLVLIVCYDQAVSWKNGFTGEDAGVLDAAIAATHIMLEAISLGLGSTFVGHFDPKLIKEVFHMPQTVQPVAILPIGYPCAETKINPLHTEKKPLRDLAVYHCF